MTHVVLYADTNILEKHAASIFRVEVCRLWYDGLHHCLVFFFYIHYLTALSIGLYSVNDRMINGIWSGWWNEGRQGKLKYSEKTCPRATLSTTNHTWLNLGSDLFNITSYPHCTNYRPWRLRQHVPLKRWYQAMQWCMVSQLRGPRSEDGFIAWGLKSD
jgi:hypothetical protein